MQLQNTLMVSLPRLGQLFLQIRVSRPRPAPIPIKKIVSASASMRFYLSPRPHSTQFRIKNALQRIHNLIPNHRKELETMSTATGSEEESLVRRVIRNNKVAGRTAYTLVVVLDRKQYTVLTYRYTNKSWFRQTADPQIVVGAASVRVGMLLVLPVVLALLSLAN